ncbi:MAG: zinc-ribbon and FHA domain-containing protein [Propionibacteriaceae bacterium]|nr:zinc-ribbon and FHA domain-containing protein [Propionibacteriaceae bacterium]
MVVCWACGNDNEEGARFCSQCGEKVLELGHSPMDDQTLTNELHSEDVSAIEGLPAGSALLVVMKGPGAGARFLLNEDITVAGRNPDSGIFLDDITVSRKHTKFTREQGSVLVEDLGSLNGTYVNRHLLKTPLLLRNGDEVQIGKYKMIYFVGSAGTE